MTNQISLDKKILVIVESPNKVTTISKIFKSLGYLNVTVMASIGHTTKIQDNRNSYRNTGIYPEKDFTANWVVDQDKKQVIEKLKAQAKISDLVLIASDPDREGESLGNHIKTLLKLNDSQYYRIKYHSITKEEIKKALENPGYLDKALCDAAEARQFIDKMIGYTLSPIAKAYVGARSVGRCQSAGLKLVVDREKEIQSFIPEEYYDLFLNFTKDNQQYAAKYCGTQEHPCERIMSTDALKNIKAECCYDTVVTDIKKRQTKDYPKPPFCTATFQQEAATRLGLKVKDAMSCAQKLFEGISINGEHLGLITYMRTDATDLAPDFLVQLQNYIEETFGSDSFYKPKAGPKAKTAQEGHEALRVIDPSLTPEKLEAYLSNDLLLKVYKLIWQRTIASGMAPALTDETTYLITNNGHNFKFVHNQLADLGYKQLYTEAIPVAKPKPNLRINELLKEIELESQAKQTLPPPRYKEATLIKELQKREIGRPSTYATILETVTSASRNYCTIESKELIPTERGMQLAGFLERSFSNIISLDYTKSLEESLDLIASNKLTKLDFLTNFYQCLESTVNSNTESVDNVLDLSTPSCPKCSGPMVIRRSRFGKLFYGCQDYPKCNGLVNIK